MSMPSSLNTFLVAGTPFMYNLPLGQYLANPMVMVHVGSYLWVGTKDPHIKFLVHFLPLQMRTRQGSQAESMADR